MLKSAETKTIAVLQFANEPCVRLRKVVRQFAEEGFNVYYIGVPRTRAPGPQWIDERRIMRVGPVVPERSARKALLAPVWARAAFRALADVSPSVVYAADLEAGVVAYAYRDRAPYVYDVLDTYADRYSLPNFLCASLRRVENAVARRATILVHVDEMRTSTLDSHHRTIIVHNKPMDPPAPRLWAHRRSGPVTLVATGNLDRRRGIHILASVVMRRRDVEVAMAGKLSPDIEAIIQGDSRFRYYGRLGSAEALALTQDCDLVFAAYDPAYTINRLACPNKLYDAMALGKPIIVNEELAIAARITTARIGLTFHYQDENSLHAVLDQMTQQPELLGDMGTRTHMLYRREGTWREEFGIVTQAIREISSRLGSHHEPHSILSPITEATY